MIFSDTADHIYINQGNCKISQILPITAEHITWWFHKLQEWDTGQSVPTIHLLIAQPGNRTQIPLYLRMYVVVKYQCVLFQFFLAYFLLIFSILSFLQVELTFHNLFGNIFWTQPWCHSLLGNIIYIFFAIYSWDCKISLRANLELWRGGEQ